MSDISIVTIASHVPAEPYYAFAEFLASLKHFDIEPIILGQGEPWRGLGTKPTTLKRAIDAGLIKTDRMIMSDAFDVMFQSDPRDIPVTPKIVFNSEKNCFPNANWAQNHPPTQSPFRYLNSGFAVGPTELFLQALKEMGADENKPDYQNPDGSWTGPNDQNYWMVQYLFGGVPISLDTHCEICQTLYGVDPNELDFSGEKIKNKEFGTTPFAFHLNGSKEQFKPMLKSHLKL